MHALVGWESARLSLAHKVALFHHRQVTLVLFSSIYTASGKVLAVTKDTAGANVTIHVITLMSHLWHVSANNLLIPSLPLPLAVETQMMPFQRVRCEWFLIVLWRTQVETMDMVRSLHWFFSPSVKRVCGEIICDKSYGITRTKCFASADACASLSVWKCFSLSASLCLSVCVHLLDPK